LIDAFQKKNGPAPLCAGAMSRLLANYGYFISQLMHMFSFAMKSLSAH
jgi:hypothetical protein